MCVCVCVCVFFFEGTLFALVENTDRGQLMLFWSDFLPATKRGVGGSPSALVLGGVGREGSGSLGLCPSWVAVFHGRQAGLALKEGRFFHGRTLKDSSSPLEGIELQEVE